MKKAVLYGLILLALGYVGHHYIHTDPRKMEAPVRPFISHLCFDHSTVVNAPECPKLVR